MVKTAVISLTMIVFMSVHVIAAEGSRPDLSKKALEIMEYAKKLSPHCVQFRINKENYLKSPFSEMVSELWLEYEKVKTCPLNDFPSGSYLPRLIAYVAIDNKIHEHISNADAILRTGGTEEDCQAVNEQIDKLIAVFPRKIKAQWPPASISKPFKIKRIADKVREKLNQLTNSNVSCSSGKNF